MSGAVKQCNHAGCRELMPLTQRYCKKHELWGHKMTYKRRVHDSDEAKRQQFYKSKAWRNMAYRFKLANPVCVKCLAKGIIKKADVADHIIEIKDDWSKRLDENNLQALCNTCHNAKTKAVKKKREEENKNLF